MIELTSHPVFLDENYQVTDSALSPEEGRKRTMAWKILSLHNTSHDPENLSLKFDAMVSPDNNYVNILQAARASGLKKFPVPYVLSNCHNTLCAVGGTINEDDHRFGLDNVIKYGGIFVPPYRAVLHQYMREMFASCSMMILGSDSHTRYGALGTMGIGEGGGELVKQLVGRTYDIKRPPVIAVRLRNKVRKGIGPMDVALTLVGACFENGFTRNKVLEFVGDGISGLSMEFRMGIDVMTTESAALSSIWCTDEKTREYLREHGREEGYQCLRPGFGAYYEGMIDIDLSQVECMIALPFHPSRALPIRELKENPEKYEEVADHVKDGKLYFDQALVSGCAGGMFENIAAAADIMRGFTVRGDGISFGINPCSMPIMAALMESSLANELALEGIPLRPCICGPCFGVTDTPANNGLSVRHVTRNYPNREGSQKSSGQRASVCLMDARSIAATVRNGGFLTAASELEDVEYRVYKHKFDRRIYENQVADYREKPQKEREAAMGPNIADWPELPSLKENLVLKVAGAYKGSLTTDDLIPSGEASSYRSNPEKLSSYMLISKDPSYLKAAKEIRDSAASDETLHALGKSFSMDPASVTYASAIVSQAIGDGSSREQAASCQKVLGGFANLANEYSTKRYRSNCINWGILPLRTDETLDIPKGSFILLRGIGARLRDGKDGFFEAELYDSAFCLTKTLKCELGPLTEEERRILLAGCLINAYRK